MLKNLFRRNREEELLNEEVNYEEIDRKLSLLCSKAGLEDTEENRQKMVILAANRARDKYLEEKIGRRALIYSVLLNLFF